MNMLEYRTISNVTKFYPHKVKQIMYNHPYQIPIGNHNKKRSKNPVSILSDIRSLRRTKTTVKDIVLCNDFDLFCTFTFAKNRNDISLLKLKMHQWLASEQRKHRKNGQQSFDYIIIPEFHKDGKSIHFHALFKNYLQPLCDSGIVHSGRVVYNIPNYTLGFNSAIIIDAKQEDIDKVANYITKYVTKDMPTFSGKKRYWVSKGLHRPITEVNSNFGNNLDRSSMIYCATQDIYTIGHLTYQTNEFKLFEYKRLN